MPLHAQSPWVTLESLPNLAVQIAQEHLEQFASESLGGNDAPDGEPPWAQTTLASQAIVVYDWAHRDAQEPAYAEFKVVAAPGAITADRGYILVTLHESDAPVAEFATSGLTPGEELLAGFDPEQALRVFRFGPGYRTVEDDTGALLAEAGTEPYRVPPELLELAHSGFSGTYHSETDQEPEDGSGGPSLTLEPYSGYEDFKADYVANPVYTTMRARRTQAVQTEWDLLHGRPVTPIPVLHLPVGQTTNLLTGNQVSRFFLDDDLPGSPLVSIVKIPADGGLQIQGLRSGAAELIAQTAQGIHKFWLRVTDPSSASLTSPAFVAGWQPVQTWYAGTPYSDQPRYFQSSASEWCPKVGCGPVAWAMMLAWWDHHGVPGAFSANPDLWESMCEVDAPLDMSAGTVNHDRLMSLYRRLHDYCDVICFPFSSQGATPPGDMVEALHDQLRFESTLLGRVGMNYGWSWDLGDPDWNEPSNYARTSIKDNRPAVLGLGWLWHYALAYGYYSQLFQTTPEESPLYQRRYFKCNEGWGKADGAWYSGTDTFLGTDLTLWQKWDRYVDGPASCSAQFGTKDCLPLTGPYRTLTLYLREACPGDALHIRAGSYDETVTFDIPMTIDSYDGIAEIGK